jgi:ubiquinone/menaquinone biosynthesis C-methylase UbiE
LDNGNEVYGIEPNAEMRLAGEKSLAGYTNFHSVDAFSEDTGLELESVDVITCGQAFHWFEPKSTRQEFLRILKPDGYVVLFNNCRKSSNNQFMNEYSELVSKYSQKEFSFSLNTDLPGFFAFKPIHETVFYNPQVFNLERLKGDLVSYSYIPTEEEPRFNTMLSEFEVLFEKYNSKGALTFEYETVLQYCKMR